MENLGWKFLRLFLGILVIGGYVNIYSTANAQPVDKETEYMPFHHPNYKARHLQIPLIITNSRILEEDGAAELRKGPFPYHPGGDTKVVYKDKDGGEIGSYFVQDPTKLIFCDEERPGGKLHIQKGGYQGGSILSAKSSYRLY